MHRDTEDSCSPLSKTFLASSSDPSRVLFGPKLHSTEVDFVFPHVPQYDKLAEASAPGHKECPMSNDTSSDELLPLKALVAQYLVKSLPVTSRILKHLSTGYPFSSAKRFHDKWCCTICLLKARSLTASSLSELWELINTAPAFEVL